MAKKNGANNGLAEDWGARFDARLDRFEALIEKRDQQIEKRQQEFEKRQHQFEKRQQVFEKGLRQIAAVTAEMAESVSAIYDMQAENERRFEQTDAKIAALAMAQAETTDKLNALIEVVDGLVRDKRSRNGKNGKQS